MSDKLEIAIKKGIKGELDSIVLYSNAAKHAPEGEVRQFFQDRAEEEKKHYNFLIQYLDIIDSAGKIDRNLSEELREADVVDSGIFSDTFLRKIGQDHILFSAISTAALLEKEALEHYLRCSKETENEYLQTFYKHMAEWEEKHYDMLIRIAEEAEQYFWELNRFEPF